jgi:DNA-binding transcriptional ArsR family regulator
VDTLDLLLHAVRLRITHAMSGGRTRTTSDLCARLPDVPKTSVYRHVGLLAEAGVLEVVDEQRVHGAVERHYRLRGERTAIDAEVAASMSLDDHRHGFTAAMAALLAEFNAYLDRESADPTADSVSYRQFPLWFNQHELAELISYVVNAVKSKMDNQSAPGRGPHLLSTILFPIEDHGSATPTNVPTIAGECKGCHVRRSERSSLIAMCGRIADRAGACSSSGGAEKRLVAGGRLLGDRLGLHRRSPGHPTWTRGRCRGSFSVRRSTSRVRGATSPPPRTR